MTTAFPCVVCNEEVRRRQEALQCDNCDRWQHRVKCTPGMTRAQYRNMCREDSPEIYWTCRQCTTEPVPDPIPADEPVRPTDPIPADEPVRPTDPIPADEPVRPADPIPADEPVRPADPIPTDEPVRPADPIPADDITMEELMEESIRDPLPEPYENEGTGVVEYTIVDEGTIRGRGKLVDSLGFSYTVKEEKGNTIYWACTVRNKKPRCLATIIERDGLYTKGKRDHIHDAQPDTLTTTTVIRQIKRKAKESLFKPATSIAEDTLKEHIDIRRPTPTLPSVNCLTRTANRARQSGRPANPKDLEFEIDLAHIPEGFLRHDVKVGEFRHLVFYTDVQSQLLNDVKTWYMDATFKVVDQPFTQMFSIHAFIRSANCMKQIPLVFVLMSKRRRIDYEQVFKHVKESLTRHSLKYAVVDFEAAVWQAFRAVFPGVSVKGCSFHWAQAVFKKIRGLGMEEAYHKQDATRRLLKKILALPYLRHDDIRTAFEDLQDQATTEPLRNLMTYVEDTWMHSTIWSVKSWSVFGRVIRTNNDCEGWHRRLNDKATRPNVQFYLLVPLLHTEATAIPLQCRLVSDGKLKRTQRKAVRDQNAKIHTYWDLFRQGNLTAMGLLREISLM